MRFGSAPLTELYVLIAYPTTAWGPKVTVNAIAHHAATPVTGANARMADVFATYARAAVDTALQRHVNGDTYGGTLAISRAEVYRSAVDLVLH